MSKYCPFYNYTVLYVDCLECEYRLDCLRGLIKEGYYMDKKENDNLIVIGIDQSYQDTGLSISYNGKIKIATHLELRKLKNNTERRHELTLFLRRVFSTVNTMSVKYDSKVIILLERIRLKSQGFVNIDYIKSIGALNATICDIAYDYKFPVYSVDTRSWKSRVVGSSKKLENQYGFDPEKYRTILWCISNGFKKYIKEPVSKQKKKAVIEKNGERYTYNDNIADSICISLYPFTGNDLLLEEEK